MWQVVGRGGPDQLRAVVPAVTVPPSFNPLENRPLELKPSGPGLPVDGGAGFQHIRKFSIRGELMFEARSR